MRDRISLVVDDEPSIRRYISTILQQDQFQCLEAEDGLRGLQIVQELGADVDLIVSDVRMPRYDGIRFAQAVNKIFPEIPIILISGHAEPVPEFQGFIQKPFTPDALLEAVRNALGTGDRAPAGV